MLGLQTTLHGIADVSGDVAEIGNAVSIARNAIAIVADGEISAGEQMRTFLDIPPSSFTVAAALQDPAR
jgi:hypothetical protein